MRAIASDLHMDYTAVGQTTHLAARMEQTAAPNTVQVAHDTYRRVAELFEFEALGEDADPIGHPTRELGAHPEPSARRTRGA